jgi:hypothetical protein
MGGDVMQSHEQGDYVEWRDYQWLLAEKQRLDTEVESLMTNPTSRLLRVEREQVERLEHQVNYWRIEAETDNARWLRCLEDLENLRKSK